MADSLPGGAAGSSWLDWSILSSAVNVIGFALLAVTVPVLQWIFKKDKARKAERRTKEDERILQISKEVTKPITDRQDGIEKILGKLTETNEALISNMEKNNEVLDKVTRTQIEMNTKVKYIDNFFQSNTRMHHPDPPHNDRDDNEDVFDRDTHKEENNRVRRKGRPPFK